MAALWPKHFGGRCLTESIRAERIHTYARVNREDNLVSAAFPVLLNLQNDDGIVHFPRKKAISTDKSRWPKMFHQTLLEIFEALGC